MVLGMAGLAPTTISDFLASVSRVTLSSAPHLSVLASTVQMLVTNSVLAAVQVHRFETSSLLVIASGAQIAAPEVSHEGWKFWDLWAPKCYGTP